MPEKNKKKHKGMEIQLQKSFLNVFMHKTT